MTKKNWLVILLAILMVFSLALVACDDGEVEATSYTVTFDSDGGSSVASQSVESGKTATEPTDPTKSNYTFSGWVDASGNAFSFSTAITADTTLKATWTATEYTATFMSGDTVVGTVKFTVEDESITEPDVPTVFGYVGTWEDYTLTTENITVECTYSIDSSYQQVTNEAELLTAIENGGGIMLMNDIDITASINVEKSITLQGNGYSINNTAATSLQETGMFHMQDTLGDTYIFVNVTLNDTTSKASGIIIENSTGGTLILDEVTISSVYYYAVRVNHQNWTGDDRTTITITNSDIEGWCALYVRGSQSVDVSFDNCNLTGINQFSGDSDRFSTISIQYSGTSGADYCNIEDINITMTNTNIYTVQTTNSAQNYISVNSGDPYIADEISITINGCSFYYKNVYELTTEEAEATEFTKLTADEVGELVFFNDYCGYDSLLDVTLTIDGESIEASIWRLSEDLLYLYEVNYANAVSEYSGLTRQDFVINYEWLDWYYVSVDEDGEYIICLASTSELDVSQDYTLVGSGTYIRLYITNSFKDALDSGEQTY